MSQSEQVIELGRKLVSQLGLDDSVNTLSRWMAHHIAELITKVECAGPDEKAAADAECRQAILDLWKVRHDLPNGRRPFQGFEQIFQSLASLDPSDDTPRYFRAARPPKGQKEDENDETREWLDLADGLDHAARILISFCLGKAAGSSTQTAREWLKAVEQLDDDRDIRIVRFVISEADVLDPSKQSDKKREALENRLSRLEAFVRLSSLLSNDLKYQLQTLSKAHEKSGKPVSRKRTKPLKSKATPVKKNKPARARRSSTARKKR